MLIQYDAATVELENLILVSDVAPLQYRQPQFKCEGRGRIITLSHSRSYTDSPLAQTRHTPFFQHRHEVCVPSSPLRGHLLLPVCGAWRTACPDTQTRPQQRPTTRHSSNTVLRWCALLTPERTPPPTASVWCMTHSVSSHITRCSGRWTTAMWL